MQVICNLDYDEGIDASDPLGDLILIDNVGDKIYIKETFLDVWLLSFLKVLDGMSSGAKDQVRVLEERYFVSVTEIDGDLVLSCDAQIIRVKHAQAIEAFKMAANDLIAELALADGIKRNLTIEQLKKICC